MMLFALLGAMPASAGKGKVTTGIASDLGFLPKGASVVFSAKLSVLTSKAVIAMAATNADVKARLQMFEGVDCTRIVADATITYGGIRDDDAMEEDVVVVSGITVAQFKACRKSQKDVTITKVKTP